MTQLFLIIPAADYGTKRLISYEPIISSASFRLYFSSAIN